MTICGVGGKRVYLSDSGMDATIQIKTDSALWQILLPSTMIYFPSNKKFGGLDTENTIQPGFDMRKMKSGNGQVVFFYCPSLILSLFAVPD